jgi:thioredoxin 1
MHSWCGPCKTLSPILQKLAGDIDIKTGSGLPIDLITVDTDEHGALAQKYGVRSTFSEMGVDD